MTWLPTLYLLLFLHFLYVTVETLNPFLVCDVRKKRDVLSSQSHMIPSGGTVVRIRVATRTPLG